MLPNIWIFDTYSLFIFLGVIACFILFWLYKKKYNLNEKYTFDIFILACISIVIGIGFAVGFQALFDLIKGSVRGSAMTFYGGLVGGVITFLLGYFLVIKKIYKETSFISDILPIAPACITVAHAFGRVGCFMAGCCYGVETDSFLGVVFPGMNHAVLPTQLFEAIFLFILTFVLFMIAIKKRWMHNLGLYFLCYGVFRFLIEFLRGDNRGGFIIGLSPSQVISIIGILVSFGLYFMLEYKRKNLK